MKKLIMICVYFVLANQASADSDWANSKVEYVKMASAANQMEIKLTSGNCSAPGELVTVKATDPLFKEKVSMAMVALTAGKTLQMWVDLDNCVAGQSNAGFIVHK